MIKIEYDLNKEEVWNACVGIQQVSIEASNNSKGAMLHATSWGLFWLSIMSVLTLFFGGNSLNIAMICSIIFLALAFLANHLYQKNFLHQSKNSFLNHSHGTESLHEFSFSDKNINFLTPAGVVEFSIDLVVTFTATQHFLIICTPICACYIPWQPLERDQFEEIVSTIRERAKVELNKDLIDFEKLST